MDNFTPLTAPGKKKKKVNKLLIFGNLFLVVIIAFAGYFYYNNVLLTQEQKASTLTGTEPEACGPLGITEDNCEGTTGGELVCEGINRLECKHSGKWCLLNANGCVDGKKASGFPSCWSESPSTPNLQCGSPGSPGAIYDTNFRGTCAQYFPALWAGPGGNCQINCLCCPTGATYTCTNSGTIYEFATSKFKKYMCQDLHHDKYISDKPNPAYNNAIPPEDNPLCSENVNNPDGRWVCKDTLTTCMQNVCSCGGATVPTATPTPTPTTPPNCSPRYFCFKSDGHCEASNQTTYTNDDVQCGGGPTCVQNLATYQTNKTTGICYRSMNECDNNCTGPTSTPTRTPTPTGTIAPTNTPTATPTSTPTATPTGTITPSNTPTSTPVVTNTPGPSATPTSTPVLTNTPGPSATPTEIILAKVSPSPTSTTQLLQTGVLKSFLYWIPAVIMLVGLIL